MSLDVRLEIKVGDMEDLPISDITNIYENYIWFLKYINADEYLCFEDWHKKNNYLEVYSANITHNLGLMAQESGIYGALWRPHRLIEGYNIDENNHKKEYVFEDMTTIYASFIIPYLERGLEKLKAEPEHYKTFDSENGWGLYIHFVPFVEKYLEACKKNPDAIIKISR